MYLVDGDDYPLEMLNIEQATTVLAGLHAEAAFTSDTASAAALSAAIAEVTDWLEYLADEAAAEAADDDAAEHAADLFADYLAGV